MANALLTSFRAISRNLELFPLSDPEAIREFRVEYGGEALADLKELVEDDATALVEDDATAKGKFIFTGHRGCGKSTLLAQLAQQLEDEYFVVPFSIAEAIEMSDVNHINILFATAVNLMYQAKLHDLTIPEEDEQNIYKWFAKKTSTDIESLSASAGMGFDLFKIVFGKLQADAVIRNEIKIEFQQKISELIDRINEIALIIEAQSDKKILVIIDDLDKLDLSVINLVFKDNIKPLCQPNFQIVYTIPVAALRDKMLKPILETEMNGQVMMGVVKLFAQDQAHQPNGIYVEKAVKTLCEMLKRRIPEDFLEEKAAHKMVLYSGGVLRELVRIAKESCRICLRLIRQRPDLVELKINDDILEEAVNNLRNDFAITLGKADFEILEQTYRNFEPQDPKQDQFLELLHGLDILEYKNRKIWYDVHPIVVELLRDRKLIDG